MTTILTVVHIAVCFFLVVIVLLQHGKGASMGATFGGSSQTMFGTEGPLPLLNKVTTAAAVIFMLTSITLAYISAHKSTSSLMSDVDVPKPTSTGIERAMEQVPDMPLQPAGSDLPLTPPAPAPMQEQQVEVVVEETAAQVSTEEGTAVVEEVVLEEVEKTQEETTPAKQE
jgi:preprotein translocase subunit SecG